MISNSFKHVSRKLAASLGDLYDKGLRRRRNLARLLDLVDQHLNDCNRVIQEQVDEKKEVEVSPITTDLQKTEGVDLEKAPLLPTYRLAATSPVSCHGLNSRRALPSDGAACRPLCACSCHLLKRMAIPPFLSKILGRLVLEHAGIPGIGTRCDTSACVKTQSLQVSAEYRPPLRGVWSKIGRFNVTYQANLGPSLQLRTLRLVPHSAPAVSFAISGDIEGLKELFGRGVASPCDVSETRGYSLTRVRLSIFLMTWSLANRICTVVQWALDSRQYKVVRFLHEAGADADYR